MGKRVNLEKHLDFIQQNINRMTTNSFSIKGWLIAIITAGFIFTSKDYSQYLILSSCILVVGFAILDATYLQNERKFRELYNLIINDENMEVFKEFEMNINHETIVSNKKTNYFSCLFSRSIIIPYSVILLYDAALFIFSIVNCK